MNYISRALSYLPYASFIIPLQYAREAVEGIFKSERSTDYEPIEEDFRDLLEQNRIRADVKVKEIYNGGFCRADGANTSRGGAAVHIVPKFKEVDPEAYRFVMRHELAHIKNNDVISFPLLGLVTSLAAAYLLFNKDSSWSTFLGTILAGKASYALFSQYEENRADIFAIAHSSIEDLKGGVRLFTAFQIFLKKVREESILHRLLIRPNGNNLIDILHPGLSQRINQIQMELKNRGVEYTEQEVLQHPAFGKLQELISFNNRVISGERMSLADAIEHGSKIGA